MVVLVQSEAIDKSSVRSLGSRSKVENPDDLSKFC